MLIYTMLKPGFVTEENIVKLRRDYLIPQRRFSVVCDGFIRYKKQDAKEHYVNLKEKPFYLDVADYISSEDVYAVVVDFDGTEKEWVEYRKKIIGATKEKDLVPGSFRYEAMIRKGLPFSPRKNAIHSSDAYKTATKEICIFLSLMKDAIEKELKKGNYKTAENILNKISLFYTDAKVRDCMFEAVRELEKKSKKKLDNEQKTELENNLLQIETISKFVEKLYKELFKTKNQKNTVKEIEKY